MAVEFLEVTSRIRIPLNELDFQFARSGGPGGQNVNKVNSKAVLRWNVRRSPSLPPAVRQRLVAHAGRRVDKEGVLMISGQRFRDQNRNVQDCLDRLQAMVAAAAVSPKIRRPTQPTRGSIASRLANKQRESRKKEGRRHPRLDGDG